MAVADGVIWCWVAVAGFDDDGETEMRDRYEMRDRGEKVRDERQGREMRDRGERVRDERQNRGERVR